MTPSLLNQILPGPRTINVEQLQAAINFEKAQIRLHENWIEAWNKRGEYEQSYTRRTWQLLGGPPPGPDAVHLENYMRWHKAYYDAEAELRNLQLAQFKSHLAINEAMLEESKKPKLFEGSNVQLS